MAFRAYVLLALTLRALAEQGVVEIVIDATGEMDVTAMLQTPTSHIKVATHSVANEHVKNEKSLAAVDAPGVSVLAALAEFVAMTLFVIIGCGSAMGSAHESGWILQVSLTFGFAITSLAYAIGHFSGGQINCAVTFGLVLSGKLSIEQGLANFAAQLVGSVTGAGLLTFITPEDSDKTGNLGSNKVDRTYSCVNAFIGEAAMTFLLMFVVLETAINPASASNRALACVAIGFAVFLAHSVLIPIDGCSINPTRSFGPAVVSLRLYKNCEDIFKDHWVFWVGPLAGAFGAVFVNHLLTEYS